MKFNNVLGMYPHNLNSYFKVREAYDNGEKICGLLHATGTGKSLIALQLALDFSEKNIVYVTPFNSIIEHIMEIIDDNPYLDFGISFKHVKFMTYSALVNLSLEELKEMNIDMLILDEFHHIGAPVWGKRIEELMKFHPELLIFGMSAYSVRDRGSAYERDLAEVGGDELFSDKIVSYYDLVDAMLDGVLPVPNYKGAHLKLLDFAKKLEDSLNTDNVPPKYLGELLNLLKNVKKQLSATDDVLKFLIDNVSNTGKYIYFCPVMSKDGVNDPYTIMKETKEYFLNNGYKEEDLYFYVSISSDFDRGVEARRCFYNDISFKNEDVSHKLRIMFTINQYNEGVHAPNVDGVILGRETNSDIVFFEQIGRALSVRGDTYKKIIEYHNYSREQLESIARDANILVKDNMSRDDIIERLVAPVIIDLVGNYSFIKDLVTELKHRIKEYKVKTSDDVRVINITDNAFSIDFKNQDLFDALFFIKNHLIRKSWDEVFILAENYFNMYNNLNIKRNFKSDDGISYDEYGYALGEWIYLQRSLFKKGELDGTKISKLNSIGMIWPSRKSWEEAYKLAENYYNKYGNLRITSSFKSNDGVNYDECGYALGNWLAMQRTRRKKGILSDKEICLLEKIGMEWSLLKTWDESYAILYSYYKDNGNANVTKGFIYDDYALGAWLYSQKTRYHDGKLDAREIKLLKDIGVSFEIVEATKTITWDEYYSLLLNYKNTYGNTDVKRSFKTFDGIVLDNEGYNLGMWVARQRVFYKKGKLSDDKVSKLNLLGFSWNEDVVFKSFEESYEIAKNFYLINGHLNVGSNYKTEDDYNLGSWIGVQRKKYKNNELDEDKILLLDNIGMIWNVNQNYFMIKQCFKKMKLNPRIYSPKVKNLSYLEFYVKTCFILSIDSKVVEDGILNPIYFMNSEKLLDIYGFTIDMLIDNYRNNVVDYIK